MPKKAASKGKKVKAPVKAPAAKKRGGGRPSSYDPKYCQQLLEFFSKPRYREVMELTEYKDGSTKESYREIPNDLPLFADFAHEIGVHRDTLDAWSKTHPEFSEAYKRAKQLQEGFLAINALRGNYNSTFSIFTAKNILGWRDVQHIEANQKLTYQDLEGAVPPAKAKDVDEARKMAGGQAA